MTGDIFVPVNNQISRNSAFNKDWVLIFSSLFACNWARFCLFGCAEVYDTCESLPKEPISVHEKLCLPVWYLEKRLFLNNGPERSLGQCSNVPKNFAFHL